LFELVFALLYFVVVVVAVDEVVLLLLLRSFLNSLSNQCNDMNNPVDSIDNMIICIRATSNNAATIVKHSKHPMTKRTNGSNIKPPPGSITCEIKEDIFLHLFPLSMLWIRTFRTTLYPTSKLTKYVEQIERLFFLSFHFRRRWGRVPVAAPNVHRH
jgi:hypothetical protein